MHSSNPPFALASLPHPFHPSPNSKHTQEIPHHKGIPAVWVDTANRIDVDNNAIQHKLYYGELVETKDWLPEGPITIGVTSGASTPDRAVRVMQKVLWILIWDRTGPRCECLCGIVLPVLSQCE